MIFSLFSINIFIILLIFIFNNINIFNKSLNLNNIIIPIVKRISLIGTILLLANIIVIFYYYNNNNLEFQFITNFLGIYWGTDSISLMFLLLIYFLLPITILSNWNNLPLKSIPIYLIIILLLGLLMSLNFLCLDIISFYVLFESTLGPLFILIGIYGATNRKKASYYIFIYTLFSSLFMLIGLVFIYYIYNNNSYIIINNYLLNIDIQVIIYIFLMIGILVKTPLFPLHSWLPLAHAESPIGGSILLAGVILKIAVYAIIRLVLPLTISANILYVPLIYTICIISIIYIGLINIRQYDLKVIIAYSSIGHMAICIMGILSNSIIGINGSLMLSIAHGLVSPALFILVGSILYDRYHNRLLYYYQGLSTYLPIYSIYLLIFSLCNIGIPLSANFIGELLTLIGSYNINPILTIIASISILISAIYQMRLTTKLLGGNKSIYLNNVLDINKREWFILNSLLIVTIILGIKPILLTQMLDINISNLIYHF